MSEIIKSEQSTINNPLDSDISELTTPPHPNSLDKILNKLNDDCLLELFASPNFDILDLLQFANVCTRFNGLAIQVFKDEYQNFQRTKIDPYDPNWPLEEICRTFGESIISFGYNGLDDQELKLAQKYCPNIKKIICLVREQETVEEIRDLITRLDTLIIRSAVECVSLESWVGADIKLKELDITRHSHILNLPKGNLPELKALYLSCVDIDGNERLFRDNPQIEELSLRLWQECEQPFDFTCFAVLQNVRVLDIYHLYGVQELQNVLKAVVDYTIPLEELSIALDHLTPESYSIYVSQIKTLKVLHIGYIRSNERIIQLATDLPNLEELEIKADSYKASDIWKLLENAGDRLKNILLIHEICMEDLNEAPDEKEFERIGVVARARGIDCTIKIGFVLHSGTIDPEIVLDKVF